MNIEFIHIEITISHSITCNNILILNKSSTYTTKHLQVLEMVRWITPCYLVFNDEN